MFMTHTVTTRSALDVENEERRVFPHAKQTFFVRTSFKPSIRLQEIEELCYRHVKYAFTS